MVKSWLIAEWVRRLAAVRREASSRELDSHDAWLLSIRERILRFLVSRYRHPVLGADEDPYAGVERHSYAEYIKPAGEDLVPEDRPPRGRDELRPLVADVARANARQRARGRWRWL